MIYNKTLSLSNGQNIPQMGFGTWLIPNDRVDIAVKNALTIGYRHIDTAQSYGNEEGVGKGLKASGLARGDVYVTTKVRAEYKNEKEAADSIEASLQRLGLDYVDLLLIHSPQPWKYVNQSDNRFKEGNLAAWAAMEKAYKAGKVKAIGVSNFEIEDIENLITHAEIAPMVNQLLVHVSQTPIDLIDYCKQHQILVEGYSPMGHGRILANAVLQELAKKYKVSVAQLCIRYVWQLGLVVLPKAENPSHIEENGRIDFMISDADMDKLKAIHQPVDYGEDSRWPVYGGKVQG